MQIPRIIHQTWKTATIPQRWRSLQAHNRALHPDFDYRLWTDEEIDKWVAKEFPVLYPSFAGYPLNITRADVIRYLIMLKVGGIYLDLDYEMLVPFDSNALVILPKNRSKSFGDARDEIGNCFFASVPGHIFWQDAIDDLIKNPPNVTNQYDNHGAAGPGFLTRIFFSKSYPDIEAPERIVYHPPSPKNKAEYSAIIQNDKSKGIHHGWGSWKDRYSWNYLKDKFFRLRNK